MSLDDMFICADCNMDTAPKSGNEYYAVVNEIWQTAKGGDCILCIGCLEARLNRELKPADFSHAAINFIFPQSDRLAARFLTPRRVWLRQNTSRILEGKDPLDS